MDYRKPSDRKSMHSRIVQELGMQIVSGRFLPDDKLPAEALLCEECGVYVASVIQIEDRTLATLNVAGVALDGFSGRSGEPVAYDDETDEDRLARRKARWTPTVLVEASPSA